MKLTSQQVAALEGFLRDYCQPTDSLEFSTLYSTEPELVLVCSVSFATTLLMELGGWLATDCKGLRWLIGHKVEIFQPELSCFAHVHFCGVEKGD